MAIVTGDAALTAYATLGSHLADVVDLSDPLRAYANAQDSQSITTRNITGNWYGHIYPYTRPAHPERPLAGYSEPFRGAPYYDAGIWTNGAANTVTCELWQSSTPAIYYDNGVGSGPLYDSPDAPGRYAADVEPEARYVTAFAMGFYSYTEPSIAMNPGTVTLTFEVFDDTTLVYSWSDSGTVAHSGHPWGPEDEVTVDLLSLTDGQGIRGDRIRTKLSLSTVGSSGTPGLDAWLIDDVWLRFFHERPVTFDGIADLEAEAVVQPGRIGSEPLPRTTVALALGQTVSDDHDSLTWTDVTEYVRLSHGIQANRGRLTDGEGTSGGNLSLVFDNTDGRFSPGTTTGPYGDGIRPRVPVRISSSVGPVWTGFLTDARWSNDDGEPVVEIVATDLVGRLSRIQAHGRGDLYGLQGVTTATTATVTPKVVLPLTDADAGNPSLQTFKATTGPDARLVKYDSSGGTEGDYAAGVESDLDGRPVLSLAPAGSNTWTPQVTVPPPTTFPEFQVMTIAAELTSVIEEPGLYRLATWVRARDSYDTLHSVDASGIGTGGANNELRHDWLGQILLDTRDRGAVHFTVWGRLVHGTKSRPGCLFVASLGYEPTDSNWFTITLGQSVHPVTGQTHPRPRLWINGAEAANAIHLEEDYQPFSETEGTEWRMSASDPGDVYRHDPQGTKWILGSGDPGACSNVTLDAIHSPDEGSGDVTITDFTGALPFTGLLAYFALYEQATSTQADPIKWPYPNEDHLLPEYVGRPLHNDPTGDRVEQLGDLFGLGSWLIADQTSDANVATQPLVAVTAATLLEEVATTERGSLAVLADGRLRAMSSRDRRQRAPSLVLDAASGVLALEGAFAVTDTDSADRARVTMQPSGEVIEATRLGSDWAVDTVTRSMVTESTTVAEALAEELANETPPLQSPSLVVSMSHAHRVGLSGQLLALELGDRIRVENLPATAPATAIELTLESITHSWTADDWTVAFDCSSATTSNGATAGQNIGPGLEVR